MIVINPNPENINHAIRTLSTAIADELFDLDIKYNTRNEIESIGPTQTTSTSSNQNENPNLNYSLNSPNYIFSTISLILLEIFILSL